MSHSPLLLHFRETVCKLTFVYFPFFLFQKETERFDAKWKTFQRWTTEIQMCAAYSGADDPCEGDACTTNVGFWKTTICTFPIHPSLSRTACAWKEGRHLFGTPSSLALYSAFISNELIAGFSGIICRFASLCCGLLTFGGGGGGGSQRRLVPAEVRCQRSPVHPRQTLHHKCPLYVPPKNTTAGSVESHEGTAKKPKPSHLVLLPVFIALPLFTLISVCAWCVRALGRGGGKEGVGGRGETT